MKNELLALEMMKKLLHKKLIIIESQIQELSKGDGNVE